MNDAERLELPHVIDAEDERWSLIDGHHYDRSGNPISFRDWARLIAYSKGNPYKRVAEDTIGDYWVSTVWLGMNHNFGDGPPLIFETMVFNQATGESDLECKRYPDEIEAMRGHNEMVEQVRLIVDATT